MEKQNILENSSAESKGNSNQHRSLSVNFTLYYRMFSFYSRRDSHIEIKFFVFTKSHITSS